jgi:TusA-related sulfurtransferase
MEFPKVLDLRGVVCPGNSVRARLVMGGFPVERTLDIYLDDGAPIENVPGSLVADGIKVLSRKKTGNYWTLTVVKPINKV